jgi:hypothetical protein
VNSVFRILLFLRSAKGLVLPINVVLIMGMGYLPLSSAQTLTIRLLNAKSGKPIQNQNVTLIWCPDCFSKSEVLVGKDGTGHVAVPSGAKTFSMMEGPRIGNEPSRIAYIDCNEPATASFQVMQALESGATSGNKCGHQTAVPRPGEIVFWALPKPWWQPDLQ